MSHFGVALDGGAAVAIALDLAGGFDSLADQCARFGGLDGGDLLGGECGPFDLRIDPIEQRSGYFGEVAGDLVLRADALAAGVIEVAARARIQGCGEYESCGIGNRPRGACDGDDAVFDRLAEDFERFAAELGELVEEENAMMREADFAGA